ncbi:hypothetical protein JCM33374_g6118 [Metschnikowia sp. JCM 33374]|nr:hypothetical protein JCM33374_g6118 [Metschnikowia sp. JCM 33374]
MNAILFLFLALVSARPDTGYGMLHVARVDGEQIEGHLRIKNDMVTLHNKGSIFNYDPAGAITSFMSGMFLSVNELGQVILTDHGKEGFAVSEDRNSQGIRLVSFNGNKVFHLCGDESIGTSSCDGAVDISILYEDFAEYR